MGDVDLARALVFDRGSAELSDQDRVMLAYAVRLTRAPHHMMADDVASLRSVGFDDAGVLDICQVTSYFAYVNRLADGLGVELEAWWRDEDLTVTREELDALGTGEGAR